MCVVENCVGNLTQEWNSWSGQRIGRMDYCWGEKKTGMNEIKIVCK